MDSAADSLTVLTRVLQEVLGDVAEVACHVDEQYPDTARAELVSRGLPDRAVAIRATPEWTELRVNDLGVSATVLDGERDEAEFEATARALAVVAREYLRGGGHLEWRRRILRPPRPRLTIQTEHGEWVLGPRTSRIPYPAQALGHD